MRRLPEGGRPEAEGSLAMDSALVPRGSSEREFALGASV